jgi:hypothetical protein
MVNESDRKPEGSVDEEAATDDQLPTVAANDTGDQPARTAARPAAAVKKIASGDPVVPAEEETLAVLPLRDIVVFPHMIAHLRR